MSARDRTSARARRGARELLIKALYQWQLAEHDEEELTRQFVSLPEFERIDQRYFRELLGAVIRNAERLDREIVQHTDRGLDQVDAVSRAVLLLGLAELSEREDVPTKVVINEAVELAKRYGPVDCFKFVNAVLDGKARGLPGRGSSRP